MRDYDIKAIETKYRGYEMRSRQEAKWAAFFDLCGWSWSYEPVDLNGWIPDFAIGETGTLCEVKPYFREEEWSDTVDKIIASGHKVDVILLGVDPTWMAKTTDPDNEESAPPVAFVLQGLSENSATMYPLNFGFTEGNGKLGLCSLEGGWVNYIWRVPNDPRITHPNKWSRVWMGADQIEEHLVSRWAEATNISKWVPLCKA